MKTYLFPEVAANGEITEWVPADVARELFDALSEFLSAELAVYPSADKGRESQTEWADRRARATNNAAFILSKSCGES